MAHGEPRRIILASWCHNRNLGAEFRELAERAGVGGCIKWLRRGSASQVERMYPGMGRYHLGHKTATMFDTAYKVDRIVQRDIPLPPSADFTPATENAHEPALLAALRRENKPDVDAGGKEGAA
ncbi:MAG TPA: hypothetical protein VHX65_13405 [Pirellulales bacterium]|jgi:hypothetical protein|nr:hypothetical protein [Pirellulales bacterium]